MADHRDEFRFSTVELNRSETLGTGSYGAVCKAKCDNLQCAAKLLYTALLEVDQTSLTDDSVNARTPLSRFLRECQFLSRVNHPNVVQYLGTYTDPDTHGIALLMELMKENLTHLLEEAQETLPLHIQTDIGHDVILAIRYLHSNDVIHRDLTSNNVLLTASGRAKVSDFGMSAVITGSRRHNTQTKCPGNVCYMPPEALEDPPVYEKSLDCFSFGVLLVQINSCLFPAPTNRFNTRQVIVDEKEVVAKLPIPEVDRRISHIRLMHDDSPLLPLALGCLNDSAIERPTARQLCEQFEVIKLTTQYTESKNQDVMDNQVKGSVQQSLTKNQLLTQVQELQKAKMMLDLKNKELHELVSLKDEELHRLADTLRQKEEPEIMTVMCQDMEAEIRHLNSVVDDLTRENSRQNEQLMLQDSTIADLQSIIKDREDYIRLTRNHLGIEIENNQVLREQLENKHAAPERGDSIYEDLECPSMWIDKDKPSKVYKLECELEEKAKEIKALNNLISINDLHIKSIETLSTKAESALSKPKPKPKPRSHSNHLQIEWKAGNRVPCLIQAGSTAVDGTMVYCRPAKSEDIYELCLKNMTWRKVRRCPSKAYTLVTIENCITAIGGMGVKKLLSLVKGITEETWQEIYPPMSIQRFNAAATYSHNKLVVAGGFSSGWKNIISDVEILDTFLCTWSKAQSLPYPIYSASATICNNSIYLVGGYYEIGRGHFSVLECSMTSLTECESNSEDGTQSKKWHKISDLPVSRSTCINLRGRLAVVGGKMSNGCFSRTIFTYNGGSNSWTPLSDMIVPRSECHAAVVNDKKIVVVGGDSQSGLTDSTEIGNIIIVK